MRRSSLVLLAAFTVAGGLFGQGQPGQNQTKAGAQASSRDSIGPNDVVLTIGEVKITREHFERLHGNPPPMYEQQVRVMGERAFAANLAQYRAFALLAARDKLDETPEFKAQMELWRDLTLWQMVMQRLLSGVRKVSEDEIKTYYESHKAEMQQGELRLILVALNPAAKSESKAGEAPKPRSAAEAKARVEELRKRVVAGGDFASLAKSESDDQRTAEKGGDFGIVRTGMKMFTPEAEAAIFSLKPAQISEPIKTDLGYYLFRLDNPRPVTLDESTASIRNKLQQEKTQTAVSAATKLFPVTFNDRYFEK